MGHAPILNELALMAVIGVAVTLMRSKIKLPVVAGLLTSGALIGPFGFGWKTSTETSEILAEVSYSYSSQSDWNFRLSD